MTRPSQQSCGWFGTTPKPIGLVLPQDRLVGLAVVPGVVPWLRAKTYQSYPDGRSSRRRHLAWQALIGSVEAVGSGCYRGMLVRGGLRFGVRFPFSLPEFTITVIISLQDYL